MLNDLEVEAFSQDLAQRVEQQTGQSVSWESIRDNLMQSFADVLPTNGATLRFNANNTYQDEDGTGTWQLVSNQLTLTDSDGEALESTVKTLNSTTLQIVTTEEIPTAGTTLSAFYSTIELALVLDFQKVP